MELIRRYREGEAKGHGVLEDYSFFANGLIDLYEATFDSKYLDYSLKVCDTMISDYYDQKSGGFFSALRNSDDLIVRAKEASDGAIPSGNSVALLVLLRLAELTSREDYRQLAEKTVGAFWGGIENNPAGHTFMLVALNFMTAKKKEIVISGEKASRPFKELLAVIHEEYLPTSVVAFAEKQVEKLCPMVEGRISKPGEGPRVFVCENYSCKLPVTTRRALLTELGLGKD